jgi:hypothetical protein
MAQIIPNKRIKDRWVFFKNFLLGLLVVKFLKVKDSTIKLVMKIVSGYENTRFIMNNILTTCMIGFDAGMCSIMIACVKVFPNV